MAFPPAGQHGHPFDVRELRRLDAADILPRDAYARCRRTWLPEMSAYLRKRRVRVGANVSLLFENAVTVRHQVHEVLYWETASDEAARARTQEELDTYRTLLPTPTGLAASLMVDGGSPQQGSEIGEALASGRCCIGLAAGDSMIPARLADADPDPAEPVKFLRFDLTRDQRRALLSGAALSIHGGVGTGRSTVHRLDPQTVLSLAADLGRDRRHRRSVAPRSTRRSGFVDHSPSIS